MSQTKLSELSTEQLLKRKQVLKGAFIALAIVWLFALGIVLYLYINKSIGKAFLPIAVLPLTMLPVFAQISALNAELKSRNQI